MFNSAAGAGVRANDRAEKATALWGLLRYLSEDTAMGISDGVQELCTAFYQLQRLCQLDNEDFYECIGNLSRFKAKLAALLERRCNSRNNDPYVMEMERRPDPYAADPQFYTLFGHDLLSPATVRLSKFPLFRSAQTPLPTTMAGLIELALRSCTEQETALLEGRLIQEIRAQIDVSNYRLAADLSKYLYVDDLSQVFQALTEPVLSAVIHSWILSGIDDADLIAIAAQNLPPEKLDEIFKKLPIRISAKEKSLEEITMQLFCRLMFQQKHDKADILLKYIARPKALMDHFHALFSTKNETLWDLKIKIASATLEFMQHAREKEDIRGHEAVSMASQQIPAEILHQGHKLWGKKKEVQSSTSGVEYPGGAPRP